MSKNIKANGLTLVIDYDECPLHPRRDFDNLGKMLCWHRRYDIGDKNPYGEPEEFRDDEELQDKIFAIYDVYGYDHSGLSISAVPFSRTIDPGGWDSGWLGVIYATKDDVLKEYGNLSDETKQEVNKRLLGEIEDYDDYLTSEHYYFTIEGLDGELLESCGSFRCDNFKDMISHMKENASGEYSVLFDKMLETQGQKGMY